MNFNFEYKFGNSDLGNQVSKFVEIEVGCFDPVKFALIDWPLYRYILPKIQEFRIRKKTMLN